MVNDGTRYERKTVQAVRGTEQRSINKWQGQGWELVDQDRGRLRTTLTFRRAKKPVPWRLVAAAAVAVVVVVAGSASVAAFTGDDDEPRAEPTPTASPSQSPTAEPSETETETATPEPSASSAPSPTEPANPDVLTAKNSDDVAKLLATGDYCDPAIGRFAKGHADDTIEFDGSVVNVFKSGARSDLTMSPGDKGPRSTTGPVFKFEGVTSADLSLKGATALKDGDLVRVTATVDVYNSDQCLLYLAPVSTELR
ncbi:hypothetical protein GCM10009623_34530 [Nocardioides aestuarii]|uniref:DUF4839 domain-containing protein n=1 Tax=Nocardioides aestuarii TaxID=252231 RepID=A0ABW4TS68_9ACTN